MLYGYNDRQNKNKNKKQTQRYGLRRKCQNYKNLNYNNNNNKKTLSLSGASRAKSPPNRIYFCYYHLACHINLFSQPQISQSETRCQILTPAHGRKKIENSKGFSSHYRPLAPPLAACSTRSLLKNNTTKKRNTLCFLAYKCNGGFLKKTEEKENGTCFIIITLENKRLSRERKRNKRNQEKKIKERKIRVVAEKRKKKTLRNGLFL